MAEKQVEVLVTESFFGFVPGTLVKVDESLVASLVERGLADPAPESISAVKKAAAEAPAKLAEALEASLDSGKRPAKAEKAPKE